jgi:hypothetical protein
MAASRQALGSRDRAAVERAINLGAMYGFNMARQFDRPPQLVIRWDGDEPHVLGAFGDAKKSELRSDAEAEVRRLEKEYHRATMKAGSNFAERYVAEEQLKEAKRRLFRVHPDSALLL